MSWTEVRVLDQARIDLLVRASGRLKAVEERMANRWLAVKYRQYLNGGWIRPDGTTAKPHTPAIAFHEACKDPEHHTFVIGGGRRSSKTFTAMSEFAAWVRGSRPWDNSKTCPLGIPRRWLIVAPNYSTAVPDVIEPYLLQRLGDIIVDKVRNQQKALVTAVLRDGSVIRINTYEQFLKVGREQTSVFQSGHYDGVLCDEVPPREVWLGIKRGLVTGRSRGWGKAIIAATPSQAEFGWLYDEVYCHAHNKGGDERGVWATEFSIYDNPSNTDEAIASLAVGLTDEEQEAIIWGRFRHLTGRVYKTFNEDIHLSGTDPLVDAEGFATSWPIIMSVDPAWRRPWYMLWSALDPHGRLHPVREWPTRDYEKIRDCSLGESDYAKIIEEIESTLPVKIRGGAEARGRDRVAFRCMDPNAGPSSVGAAGSGKSMSQLLEPWGYYFDVEIEDSIEAGHTQIRDMLKLPNPDAPLSELNSPGLIIHSTPDNPLRNLIWAMNHYIYDDYRDASRSPKERVRDMGKDPADALRYAKMSEPWYFDWRDRGRRFREASARRAQSRLRSRYA